MQEEIIIELKTETDYYDEKNDEREDKKDDEGENSLKALEQSRLNKPVTFSSLIAFTIPTVISMLIMGAFQIVSMVFASRGISLDALAAVSYVGPFFSIAMAIGAMLSMGGSALVAKLKGAKQNQKAREVFSLLTVVGIISSIALSIISFFLRAPILRLLGARGIDEYVFNLSLDYMIPIIWTMPVMILGMLFVQFMIADGRPILSLVTSSAGSLLTIGLNAIFIFVLDLGVFGLGLSTGMGFSVQVIIGCIFFARNKKGTLYFVKPKWDMRAVGRSSINGISEMIGSMAAAITTILLNNVLTDIIGSDGVGAAGIVLALQMLFMSLYMGYSMGIAPIISYNHGKQNIDKIKSLFKKSLIIVSILSVITLGMTFILADPMVRIFVDPYYIFMPIDAYGNFAYINVTRDFHDMAVRGMMIVATAFVFMGFNFFGSGMLTAFNDGLMSGIMTAARSLVFMIGLLLTLPRVMGIDGAWLALPLAEALAMIVTVVIVIKMGKKYKYLGK